MKNKKGYTMMELLAVIIILGILMTLAYVGVTKYLKQTKDTVYKDFEKNITAGAENYLVEHSSKIPKVGEKLVIDVSKLVCEGYIESLEDPVKTNKTCNIESYAIITRKDNTEYNMDIEYTACLKCSNYESPACSNSITGIPRLTKEDSCEVD